MKQHNLNNEVVMYPTLLGWEKIIEITKEKVVIAPKLIDEWIDYHKTEDGGFKHPLWMFAHIYGEMFYQGKPYWEHMNMGLAGKITGDSISFDEAHKSLPVVGDENCDHVWEAVPEYDNSKPLMSDETICSKCGATPEILRPNRTVEAKGCEHLWEAVAVNDHLGPYEARCIRCGDTPDPTRLDHTCTCPKPKNDHDHTIGADCPLHSPPKHTNPL